MASGKFLPGGFTFNINGQYYTQGTFIGNQGPYLGDIAIDEIVSIVLTSKFPQSDGTTYLPAFRIVVNSKKTYKDTVFYLTAEGLTLANMAAAILAIDSTARFTTYTGLVSIDYNADAILDYGSALLNDEQCSNQRIYNQNANTTDVFMGLRHHVNGPQVWTFTGNFTYAGTPTYL